ncbi:P-loop containing nucleoside triphosphate hydrolase protein [Patellaria atrata CBS 101060]|uniref:Ribosome assembly protein 1 n=1 Tax=Patellaria atrata CBS 101060 TaxID=1346257 RepID=A0A9P4S597_9PEZI|nr:P-loop containing nucleoside triphosphate hydrolase protein [Patellaria atrata CBS 101060]
MPVVNPDKLITLQQASQDVRNICILAHVDHGKTSLTDALIATNGIISPKLAGKIRYLDSRPDEQLRGITMESSAISLYFSLSRRNAPEAKPEQKKYLINLIDSPGHIDFSSEVSTASRLCDGAVVLVDAVEGVCSQTVTVLRQTWIEKLKPLLVINKMDRLVTELKMSPGEAYTHLSKLLEQVNAVMGSFFQGDRMEDDLRWRERVEEKVNAKAQRQENAANSNDVESLVSGTTGEYEEKDDEDIYFAPEKNNVIFSSAIDGWAFTVKQFAGLYEKKLGIKRTVLEKVLWGDFYLDPKAKRVLGSKALKGRNLKPMFVQLVLENIWAVYEATTGSSSGKGDQTMVEKIIKSLSLNVPAHVLRSRDPRVLLTTVFASWLPLSTALLVSVIEHLPSPPAAQAARMGGLLDSSPGAAHIDPKVRDAVTTFKTSKNDPIVAYVSKMVAIPESELPQNKRRGGNLSAEEARELARKKRAEIAKAQANTNSDSNGFGALTDSFNTAAIGEDEADGELLQKDDPEHLIGFARLYSGTLSVGDSIYVLPPKFTPAHPHAKPVPQKVTVTALYLLMGRSLEPLTSVPAGCVFGIAGLKGRILKSGTLCSQLEGAVNLAGIRTGSKPIVRVALEPANPADLDKMVDGLKMLEQSDPCAEYEVLESGEHVILTAGELHLERCLKDLRERLAKCEIQQGEPIVPYRETIVAAPEMNPPRDPNLPRGTVVGVTTSKQVTVRLRVRPLPAAVTEFLDKNSSIIKRFYSERKAREQRHMAQDEEDDSSEEETDDEAIKEEDLDVIDTGASMTLQEFKDKLRDAFAEAKGERDVWTGVVDKIAAFGPRRVGPNILIDMTKDGICGRALQEWVPSSTTPSTQPSTPHSLSDKIAYAFQLSTHQGPLCHEPIQGIAVLLEDVTITSSSTDALPAGRLTGEVIKTVRDSIRLGFLDWSPRILLAIYTVEIQASAEVLGRVYTTLSKRRGRIVSETLPEGSHLFLVSALLPISESFGFSDDIRKRTSGAASPQLIFAGFEMLDEDPFWIPSTEEEIEDLGEKGDRENVAKRYVDRVRVRKGLVVQGRKLVENAEKQKTLKR